MDVTVAYESIKDMLVEARYKIYTPAWRYCHLKPAFLAVYPEAGRESAYLVKQWKGKLLVGWLQPGKENRQINERLKTEFPKKLVRFRPRLLYPFRYDSWSELYRLVTPSQQREFKLLTYAEE